jgi:transcriptional regulator with XRE-family HTH domain
LNSKNIEYLRKQRKWTQREMGERINKVRQTVANWEAGVVEPKASELELISEVFDTTISAIISMLSICII